METEIIEDTEPVDYKNNWPVTLTYHSFGTQLAVAIKGEQKEDVEAYFNLLWNYKATDRDIKWLDFYFDVYHVYMGYFWTDRLSLKKAFYNILEMRYARAEGEIEDLLPEQQQLRIKRLISETNEWLNSLQGEEFINNNQVSINIDTYNCLPQQTEYAV